MSPASNQSLERTPCGTPRCMGLPCMVSLSSSRSAIMKIRLLLILLGFSTVARALEPSEQATLVSGINRATVIATGNIGPSACGGGGTTSEISIKRVLYDPKHLVNQDKIIIAWATSKEPKKLSNNYIWFLNLDEKEKTLIDFSSDPLVESTDSAITFVSSHLKTQRAKPGAAANALRR